MKNIIMLLTDSLRFDYVVSEVTPNLIHIAEDGVWYENCMAGNTATIKSMPIILCSSKRYDPSKSIMARLRRYGYCSVLIHSNPLVGREFSRGWDIAIDIHSAKGHRKQKLRRLMRKYVPHWAFKLIRGFYRSLEDEEGYLPYVKAEKKLKHVLELLPDLPEPYFLWVHLMDPHMPYYPKRTELTHLELVRINDKLMDAVHGRYTLTEEEIELLKSLYRQEVSEMDEAIGEFYRAVDWSDKILVVTSDHGEEFGEHGGFSHHEDKFIEELQHVPLIIVDGVERGIVHEEFSHWNLAPLILSKALGEE